MNVLNEGKAAVFVAASGPSGVAIQELPPVAPPEGYATVRMRTAALNHMDLWVTGGAQRVQPPQVIAADGAGVVVSSPDPRFAPGDEVVLYPVTCCWACSACRSGQQVFCPSFGIFSETGPGVASERVHAPIQNLFRKPSGLSWEEAAAFPLTFLTAWRMIVSRARLQPGETMLVVGAGSGVGAAAIAIGRHLGARVLATSRSEEKRAQAIAMGAERAFDSAGFSKAVREATGGQGVEVVFEHVGPATMDESLRSLRRGGRLVFCGSTSGVKYELVMPRVFFGQFDLMGSTMGNVSDFEAVIAALEAGMRPAVDRVFPLDQAVAALEHLERTTQFGKVVLSIA